MIQQVAVAVRRILQFFQEIGDQAYVVAVHLGEIRDLGRRLSVMRAGMERNFNAALGVDALADVA